MRDDVRIVRLLWVTPMAAGAAALVNVSVRTAVVWAADIPDQFLPLTLGPTVLFTVAGVIGGAVVLAGLALVSHRPVPMFRRIAAGVLVVSFLPDLLLLGGAFPATTLVGVLVLMFEHVTTWAITVWTLTHVAVRAPRQGADVTGP